MNLINKTMKLKNWAVVGATNKKNRFGYKILKKLKAKNYNVYPVNPNFDQIDGIKCYNNLSSIESEIDVVDLVVNPKIGIKIIKEIKELGIDYVWLQPGTRSKEIRDFAAENDIKIIEDCIYARL